MSIELDPVELGFRRPFTHEVAETLHLKNPNSEPVAFKVKTTAPKQYCVRPNSGRIEGGKEVEVQVLLQAMREDPPEGTKCRDKFLVQSVKIGADQETTGVADIWANIEKAKSSISEKKIRVSFLPADGSAATPARSTFANHDEEPPAYSSPASNMNTPAAAKTSDVKDAGDVHGDAGTAAVVGGSAAAGAAVASVASVAPTKDDSKAKLAEAQAEIKRLTAQVQDGVRQRKALSESSSGAGGVTTTLQQTPAGVAVPMVAALCLLSFLLAYFLF